MSSRPSSMSPSGPICPRHCRQARLWLSNRSCLGLNRQTKHSDAWTDSRPFCPIRRSPWEEDAPSISSEVPRGTRVGTLQEMRERVQSTPLSPNPANLGFARILFAAQNRDSNSSKRPIIAPGVDSRSATPSHSFCRNNDPWPAYSSYQNPPRLL